MRGSNANSTSKMCLERMLVMALGETYVRRHLQIIDMRIAKRRAAVKGKAAKGEG